MEYGFRRSLGGGYKRLNLMPIWKITEKYEEFKITQ